MRIWMTMILALSLPLLSFGQDLGENEGVETPPEAETLEELRRLVFVERKNPPKKAVPSVSQVPGNLFAQPHAPGRLVRPPPDFSAPRTVPPAPQVRRVPQTLQAPQALQAPQRPPRILKGLDPEMLARLQPSVMDRLRRGMQPLPIPLTAESIETLTKEGVEIPDYLRP